MTATLTTGNDEVLADLNDAVQRPLGIMYYACADRRCTEQIEYFMAVLRDTRNDVRTIASFTETALGLIGELIRNCGTENDEFRAELANLTSMVGTALSRLAH